MENLRLAFLEGERIDLCALNKARHLINCAKWLNNQEVTKFIGARNFPLPLEEEEQWFDARFKKEDKNNLVLAIETKEGKHIGNIGLHQIDWQSRNAEMGIMIGEKDEWGKGYATEAEKMMVDYGFNGLGLKKIYARIVSENKGSLGAAKKVGFTEEGVLKSHSWRNGKFWDLVLLAIIK